MWSWFESRLNPYPMQDPQEPPRGLLQFCLHHIDGAKKWLAAMSFAAAAIALFEVLMFAFMGNIIDWLSTADRATFLETEGPKLWAMAIVVLIITPLLAAFSSLVMHQTLLGNLPQRIRWMTHRYLIRQSMSYFQDEFAGRIATKLMQTSLAVREVVMKLLDMLVYVTFYFIGSVALVASGDWRLSMPFVIWGIVYGVMLWYFVPRLSKISQQQADARSTMTGRVVDSYTNITTVKLFSHSRREEDYTKGAMDEFLSTVYRQMRLSSLLDILVTTSNMLLLAGVGFMGIYLWLQGLTTPGAVAVAGALIMRLVGFSHWLMWETSALFENIGTVRDGINSIALPRLVRDAEEAKPLPRVQGQIRFEDVTFKYGGPVNTKKPVSVIEHMTLEIAPGEKVGLVGRSGAGKSTLVNLLLRFYDLDEGRITIDGTDISSVTQESLRGNIGVVTQDTSLLHRSVHDNIAYGRPEASEQDVIRAAEMAEAHEFILGLADAKGHRAYDAHVGERGVKLSGGQRQRIAIARVLLKDAPILVLDEATSALDSEAEAAIQAQLAALMRNKTVIAIAHRLSTIAAMDRLIVLDKGKIVEQGAHDELLALGGHYAALWKRQSGGFLDIEDEGDNAEIETSS